MRYLLYLGSAYRGQKPEVFLPGLLGQVLGSAPGVINIVSGRLKIPVIGSMTTRRLVANKMPAADIYEIKVIGISPTVISCVFFALWGTFVGGNGRIRCGVVGQKSGRRGRKAVWEIVVPNVRSHDPG